MKTQTYTGKLTKIGDQLWTDLLDIDVPGSVKIGGIRYHTYEQAVKAAKLLGNGFRLPTRGNFVRLAEFIEYNPDKLEEVGFKKTGLCDMKYEEVSYTENYGSYWSSTYITPLNAYTIRFDNSDIEPQGYNYRHIGLAVRCVKTVC